MQGLKYLVIDIDRSYNLSEIDYDNLKFLEKFPKLERANILGWILEKSDTSDDLSLLVGNPTKLLEKRAVHLKFQEYNLAGDFAARNFPQMVPTISHVDSVTLALDQVCTVARHLR